MPRPLTEASLRVLSLVTRYGLYLWSPGSVAILDDPWRSAVHVGSVSSLLRRGLLVLRNEFEVEANAAGVAVLENSVAQAKATLSVTVANTATTILVTGFPDSSSSSLAARRVADSFRLFAAAEPAGWEHLADLAFAGRENPTMGQLLVAALESLDAETSRASDVELNVVFTAVGPRVAQSPSGL